MEFAVQVNGEEKGYWVLDVDGDRLLTTDDDGRFRWIAMADCKLVKVVSPELPKPVVVVQPPAAPKLSLPQLKIGNGRAN